MLLSLALHSRCVHLLSLRTRSALRSTDSLYFMRLISDRWRLFSAQDLAEYERSTLITLGASRSLISGLFLSSESTLFYNLLT